MSDKVDGQCILCGERKLRVEGTVVFHLWCQACGTTWSGPDLGSLVEAALRPANWQGPTFGPDDVEAAPDPEDDGAEVEDDEEDED